MREISPNLGAVARGRARVLRLRLADGRGLVTTPDHEIRTKLGWCPMGDLLADDAVACLPYVGVPRTGSVPFPEPATAAVLTAPRPAVPAGLRHAGEMKAYIDLLFLALVILLCIAKIVAN